MWLLDDIKNAILSFFQTLASFLVNILITIKDKLLDFISWLANGLWSLFLSIFNKVKDAISELFIRPLTDFTNRVLNRFYQKVDGMIMILVGVPLTWKSIENFINDPSKKRLMFIPLALVFSYFISKIVGQVIRTFMSKWISQGISLPSLPSASVPKLPTVNQVDSLSKDAFNYSIRPAPYITDTLISDKVSAGVKPASVFTDTLSSDRFSSLIKSGNIYQTKQLDTLLNDVINTSGKIPISLVDNVLSDTLNYLMSLHVYNNLTDNMALSDTLTTLIRPNKLVSSSNSLLTDSLTYSYQYQISGITTYSDNVSPNIYVSGITAYSDNTSAVLFAYGNTTYSDNVSLS